MFDKKLEPWLRERLPSPKDTAVAIMSACQSDRVSVQEIAALVQTDPALTAKLIAFANSAQFCKQAVHSIDNAIQRIGLLPTRNVALSFSLLERFNSGECLGFDYQSFWRSSLLMGVLTQRFGHRLVGIAGSDLFVLGILARIGCLGLASAFPKQYSNPLAAAADNVDLLVYERSCFQTDHLELSGWMLEQWGFDNDFTYAAANHETPQDDERLLNSRRSKLRNLLNIVWNCGNFLEEYELPTLIESKKLLKGLPWVQLDAEDFHLSILASLHDLETLQSVLFPKPNSETKTRTRKLFSTSDAASQTKVRVLLIDRTPGFFNEISTILDKDITLTLHRVGGIHEGIEAYCDFLPNLLLMEMREPTEDCFQFCLNLRKSPRGRDVFILGISSNSGPDMASVASQCGVDFHYQGHSSGALIKTFLKTALARVHKSDALRAQHQDLFYVAAELSKANRELSEVALMDALTELPNRRAGVVEIDIAMGRVDDRSAELAVMLLDIDDFKKVNDTYGHAVGDTALHQVAKSILATTRNSDTVCRWGGEEFLVICPGIDLEGAAKLGERICSNVQSAKILSKGTAFSVTVSIGIAISSSGSSCRDEMIDIADIAMYEAKTNGKNRVVIKDCSMSTRHS